MFTIGYPPNSIGGTEIYVRTLVEELVSQGHKVTVVIASKHDKLNVKALVSVYEMSLQYFQKHIRQESYHVAHVHPLYASLFLSYLEECRNHAIPITLTYHTPTLSCMRGDLLFMGRQVCDGEIQQYRCTVCSLQQKGLSAWFGRVVAISPGLSILRSIVPAGKIKSMFSIPQQVRDNHQSWKRLVRLVDSWVAVSIWVKEILGRNGVSSGSVLVSRQVNCHSNTALIAVKNRNINSKKSCLKIGYVGRIHPYKGLHILLKAVRNLPAVKLELHIAGDLDGATTEYKNLLDAEVAEDSRVKWHGKLAPEKVADFMYLTDVIVVPSIWMETGPMTILEAWAAGKPVIGSDRGGIREWINRYGGGWLVPAGDVCALSSLIENIVNKQIAFPDVPDIEDIPSVSDLAHQMTKVYENLVGKYV